MKNIFVVCLLMLLAPSVTHASKLNLTPYFGLGVVGLQAETANDKATSPSLEFIAGSSMDWISSRLGVEFRFGFGGQFTTANGSISHYASYLLKPSLPLTEQFDVYGLLGMTGMRVKLAGINSTDAALSYGVGLRYYIPHESLSLNGEWMMYRKNSDNSLTDISGLKVTGLSLSVVFEYY